MKFLIYALCLLWIPAVAAETGSVEPPTLRERVPLDAVAYIRIPNPWGFLTAPKDTILAKALENPVHRRQIQGLKPALGHTLLEGFQTHTRPGLLQVLKHLVSPLEGIFMLTPNSGGEFVPAVFLSARLELSSLDAVRDLLDDLVSRTPTVKILHELSAEGGGVLLVAGLPVLLHFDTARRTLDLMGGESVNSGLFDRIRSSLVPVPQHPMHRLERQVDTSGQGFFGWVDYQRLLPLVRSQMDPEVVDVLHKWGLDEIRALGMGWGASRGKGRLRLMVEAPKAGYRRHLPDIDNRLQFSACGQPRALLCLGVPSVELLAGIEAILAQEMGTQELESFHRAKQTLVGEAGFTVEELLGAIGPEMILVMDEIGEFAALRIRDQTMLPKILDFAVRKFGARHETRRIQAIDLQYLQIPSRVPSKVRLPAGLGLKAFVPNAYLNRNTHLYWVQEEDYLVFARVPQLLIDRQRHQQRVAVAEWLATHQGQESSAALLLLSATMNETPRRAYYTYLEILNFLADLAGQSLDLFQLPTAGDLSLPPVGTYGLQLDMSGELIALELVFENNPLEFLLSQDLGSVAMLGVMAAIAIPNFIEYQKRARVPAY